ELWEPCQRHVHPGAGIVDRFEHDACESGLSLAGRSKCNTETRADQGKDALLASRVCMEPCIPPKEHRVELSRDLAVLPALDQYDLLPEVVPTDLSLSSEWMSGRKRRHQPIAIHRQAGYARPQCAGGSEDDIQTAFLNCGHEIAIIQLRHGEDDIRIHFAP